LPSYTGLPLPRTATLALSCATRVAGVGRCRARRQAAFHAHSEVRTKRVRGTRTERPWPCGCLSSRTERLRPSLRATSALHVKPGAGISTLKPCVRRPLPLVAVCPVSWFDQSATGTGAGTGVRRALTACRRGSSRSSASTAFRSGGHRRSGAAHPRSGARLHRSPLERPCGVSRWRAGAGRGGRARRTSRVPATLRPGCTTATGPCSRGGWPSQGAR
jgi:hypothetical protein